ncbi:MAG: DNA-3-methyladenine glycosylase [Coriobacteriia bacterium]|nr:DNA-3-methyladenine glycosylase [Coriobacteriia bacterium]
MPISGSLVAPDFFSRNTREVAIALLGKTIVTVEGGVATGGRVVETEAYLGTDDPGSHAATRGITMRNAVMYGPPGHAYVYFTYGMHHMLNLVCEPEGTAGAVLVRAFEPTIGIETMLARRSGRALREIASGPGRAAAALGISLGDNGIQLNENRIFVYDAPEPQSSAIVSSGRIGLSAGHDRELRFYLSDDPFVSRGRTGHRAGKHTRTS